MFIVVHSFLYIDIAAADSQNRRHSGESQNPGRPLISTHCVFTRNEVIARQSNLGWSCKQYLFFHEWTMHVCYWNQDRI